MKKNIIVIFIVALSLQFSAIGQHQKIVKSLDSLLTGSFFDTTLVAVDIYNLSKKKVVYQKNQKMLLHPASNMKIYSSAAGLLYLGPDYEFTTSMFTDGGIVNGALSGDLYIRGGFDPDFTSEHFTHLLEIFKELGITRIDGSIIADLSQKDSLYWGSGWMWDDDPSTDAPYLSALNINDNAIKVRIKPGTKDEKAIVELIPSTLFFNIINEAITVEKPSREIVVTRDFVSHLNDIIIKGEIGLNSNPIIKEINVSTPHFYFLNLFYEFLTTNGIQISGDLGFTTIDFEELSPLISIKRKYSDVIVNLNKASDNLSAEMTILAIADKYFDSPASTKNGLLYVDSMILQAGFKPSNYRIVDGSGVSHYNLVSSELTLGILKLFYNKYPEYHKILEASFPFAGYDGTLRNRMKGTAAQNNVKAKTGSLSGVSTLSGYAYSKSGDVFAFSIFVQNHFRKGQRVSEIQNKICEILCEY